MLLTHAHPDHAGERRTSRARRAVLRDPRGRRRARPHRHLAAAGPDAASRAAARPPREGSFDPVPVERGLVDGEVLDVAGGLRVIHTPGHSPGHASFLHEPTGTLVTGDAIFNVRGVRWPVASFCTSYAMTKATAHRLVEVDY
ncbi:MBL fold metallo-hydrolase, partial [Janibacter melonis]|uniref:MBL fold metallo-hydrolase n=1 Tax=Janibacter melonis TaxID=262209 RepID=UPI0027DA9C84